MKTQAQVDEQVNARKQAVRDFIIEHLMPNTNPIGRFKIGITHEGFEYTLLVINEGHAR